MYADIHQTFLARNKYCELIGFQVVEPIDFKNRFSKGVLSAEKKK